MDTEIRLAVCDDHRVVTEALSDMFNAVEGLSCVGTAAQGEEALFLLEHVAVDVLLTDLDMPVMDGFELLTSVQRTHPNTKVIVLSMHDEAALVKRAMEQGADGYVVKSAGKDELILAVREVFAGRRYFGGSATDALLGGNKAGANGSGVLADLTEREVEVLAALAEGLGNKEIGERLFISPRTVDTHRTNLMRKLDTHNVAALVRIAIKAGLVR
ncbi:MAG TPA: response regulator transcription factor [Flavobacteriales bacterium]|nr:response regulator transcription factor [Flavobacteriales bacterium]